jgi:hypothetical protein
VSDVPNNSDEGKDLDDLTLAQEFALPTGHNANGGVLTIGGVPQHRCNFHNIPC